MRGRGGLVGGVGGYTADYPDKSYVKMMAGVTVVVGDVVQHASTAQVATAAAINPNATAGAVCVVCVTLGPPIGVVCDLLGGAGAAGTYVIIQTGGVGEVAIAVTDNNCVAGGVIVTAADGAVTGTATASITDPDQIPGIVGFSLADDGGTTHAAGSYILFPFAAP